MTPPQTKLLTFRDAGGSLTEYNAETVVGTRDVPTDEIRDIASATGLLQAWIAVSADTNNPAAPVCGAILAAIATFKTINPGDALFAALTGPIAGTPLYPAEADAALQAVAQITTSRRAEDGWLAPVTEADEAAARVVRINDLINGVYNLVTAVEPEWGAALQAAGLYPAEQNFATAAGSARLQANAIRAARIAKRDRMQALGLPPAATLVELDAWVEM